jgi:hypothetical protein
MAVQVESNWDLAVLKGKLMERGIDYGIRPRLKALRVLLQNQFDTDFENEQPQQPDWTLEVLPIAGALNVKAGWGMKTLRTKLNELSITDEWIDLERQKNRLRNCLQDAYNKFEMNEAEEAAELRRQAAFALTQGDEVVAAKDDTAAKTTVESGANMGSLAALAALSSLTKGCQSSLSRTANTFTPTPQASSEGGELVAAVAVISLSSIEKGDWVLASSYAGDKALSPDILAANDILAYRVLEPALSQPYVSLQFIECLSMTTAGPTGLRSPPALFSDSPTFLVAQGHFRDLLNQRHPAPLEGITNVTAAANIIASSQDFSTALKESVSAPKTPGGNGVGAAAAAVLSKRPAEVLKQGNTKIYNSLFNCLSSDPFIIFWGIGVWRIQLQLAQIITLFKTWSGTIPDTFACLADWHNDYDCRKECQRFRSVVDKVDESIVINLSILARSVDSFRHAIMSYCATLDAIYFFKEPIRMAIRATATRLCEMADEFRGDVSSSHTASIFRYLLEYFFMKMDELYQAVLGDRLNEDNLVSALNALPETGANSRFQRRLGAMQAALYSAKSDTINYHSSDEPASKKVKFAPAIVVDSDLDDSLKLICGHFNTPKGCKFGSACKRGHRNPGTAEDRSELVDFFKHFKHRAKKGSKSA